MPRLATLLTGGLDPKPNQPRVALVGGERERQHVLETHLRPQPRLACAVQRVARLAQSVVRLWEHRYGREWVVYSGPKSLW